MKCASLVSQNPSECVSWCITLMRGSSLPCRNRKHSQLWVTIKDIFFSSLILSYYSSPGPRQFLHMYSCSVSSKTWNRLRLETGLLKIYTMLSAAFRSPVFFFLKFLVTLASLVDFLLHLFISWISLGSFWFLLLWDKAWKLTSVSKLRPMQNLVFWFSRTLHCPSLLEYIGIY